MSGEAGGVALPLTRLEDCAMSAGIDYGLGRTNIDHATGIRYGVISVHAITQAWYDTAEADYGDPTCPKCTGPVVEYDDDRHGECEIGHVFKPYSRISANEYVCEQCKHVLASEECYSEDPHGYTYTEDGLQAESCLDSDVIVTRSPYYTYGPFCSPCVPGGVTLDPSNGQAYTAETGIKAYCFGHDWFDDGKAPYTVYRVADDTEVLPE